MCCTRESNSVRSVAVFTISSFCSSKIVKLSNSFAMGLPRMSTDCEGGSGRVIRKDLNISRWRTTRWCISSTALHPRNLRVDPVTAAGSWLNASTSSRGRGKWGIPGVFIAACWIASYSLTAADIRLSVCRTRWLCAWASSNSLGQ